MRKGPSLLLEPLRGRWRRAQPGDAGALAAEIGRWQQALWSFKSVGHMKAWQVPVSPVATTTDVRLKIPPPAAGESEVRLYLAAGDAGDGNEHDFAVWQRPRIVAPGRPDLSLRDVREVSRELAETRGRVFASAAKCLSAAAEAAAGGGKFDVSELARRHGVEPDVLDAWLDYLGIGSGGRSRSSATSPRRWRRSRATTSSRGGAPASCRASSPIRPTSTSASRAT